MNSKITTHAIAIFFALTLAASEGAAQCTANTTGNLEPAYTAPGVDNPDPANITKLKGQAPAVGDEAEIWVYPTGNPNFDPRNIQWAVNNVAEDGTGRVLLKQYAKGTTIHTNFNFCKPDFIETGTLGPNGKPIVSPQGPTLRVNILRNLTIKGEFDSRETIGIGVNKGTTVWGGNYTFHIGNNESVPAIQPSVTIQDIRFDGAAPGPIKFDAGQGYNEVSGCSIVKYEWGKTLNGITGAFPIIAHPGVDPSLLKGTFKIMDNFIGAPVAKDNLNNLMHISNADLDLTISGNTIEDAYWVAIAVFGNTGTTHITGNTIKKKASRLFEGAAISVGGPTPTMFSNQAYDGTTVIKGNTITVSSPNSAGILLLLYPKDQYNSSVTVPSNLTYEVSDNVITMNNARAALACIGACSKTIWKNNTVKGTGAYGILVTQTIPDKAEPIKQGAPNFPSTNRFERNNLTAFTATFLQLFVGDLATKNTFVHNCYGDVNPPKIVIGAIAGALVEGDLNILSNENFHGLDYAGKYPLVLLGNGAAWPFGSFASENNYVRVFHNGKLASCDQIIDQNWELTGTTTNTVPACKKGGASNQGAGPFHEAIGVKVPIELTTGTPVCPSLALPHSLPWKEKKLPVEPGPPTTMQ